MTDVFASANFARPDFTYAIRGAGTGIGSETRPINVSVNYLIKL